MRGVVWALTGHREDLNLSSRWWHRLFLVLFVLFMLFLVPAVYLVAYESVTIPRRLEKVRVHETLHNFLQQDWFAQFPRADGTVQEDIFPKFEELYGDVGIIDRQTGEILEVSGPLEKYFREGITCHHHADVMAGGFKASNEAVVKDANGEWILDRAKGPVWRALDDYPNQPKDQRRHCYAYQSSPAFTAADVVRYDFAFGARAEKIVKSLLGAGVASSLVFLILANVYYRGFVYVICGPRGSRHTGQV